MSPRDRVLLGQMVKGSLERRREQYRRPIVDSLKDLALDVQENPLLRDELVLNMALLVQRSAEEELTRRVRELDQRFHDQLNFRIIGPLPPYSFSTVEVSRPALEELEEARLMLGLGTQVCDAEVRQAYRKLVAASHPDVVASQARSTAETDAKVYAEQARAASSYDYTAALASVT